MATLDHTFISVLHSLRVLARQTKKQGGERITPYSRVSRGKQGLQTKAGVYRLKQGLQTKARLKQGATD